MIILCLKTDQPQASIALYDDQKLLAEETWEAHRQLAETIHKKIDNLLKSQNNATIEGFVCYKGPGSFTGLRIGLSVANSLAYALGAPIVATNQADWQQTGIAALLRGEDQKVALPEYGGEVHITKPRK